MSKAEATKRALARYAAQQAQAKPLSEEAYRKLSEGGAVPEVPEHAGEYPRELYPFSVLSESEGRRLAFVMSALPEKAAELQGLWLGSVDVSRPDRP